MKFEIKGDNLIMTMPLAKEPATSRSGKTKIVAGTNGFVKTGVEYLGSEVSISVNATIPN